MSNPESKDHIPGLKTIADRQGQIKSLELDPHTFHIKATIEAITCQILTGDRIIRIIGKDVFTLSPENIKKLKENSSTNSAQFFKKFVSKLLQSDVVIFSKVREHESSRSL